MRKEIIPIERIAQSILYLRDQKVILDRDLASLYGVETRALNQAVKRNADRFRDDFVFTSSRSEIERISQTVTSSSGLKFSKRVRVFTEQGVAMQSSVLNSERVGERTRLGCWRSRARDRKHFNTKQNRSSFWRGAKTSTRGRVRSPAHSA